MAEVTKLPVDLYEARVRRTAVWLSGHAGRSVRVRNSNLSREVNGYLAALQVAGVSTYIAIQRAEGFRADVLARLVIIHDATAALPACEVIAFPLPRASTPLHHQGPRGTA